MIKNMCNLHDNGWVLPSLLGTHFDALGKLQPKLILTLFLVGDGSSVLL